MSTRHKYHLIDFVAYILMIACFPFNPLVMLDIIDPEEYMILTVTGVIVWTVGMVFVIYPFIHFKRKGDVDRGKAYVHTKKLVTGGLYSIVRHVQYTGGILSIFIATPLLYPHWIFVVLGIPGIYLTWLGTKREDSLLLDKFGDEYFAYMNRVPAINIITGIYRSIVRYRRSS